MAADPDVASMRGGPGDGDAEVGPPADVAPTGPRRRGRRLVVAGVLLVVLLAVAGRVTLPYYAISPGGTFDTSALVEAPPERSFPPSGRLAFPTVSTGRTTILEAVVGWLDPDVDVRDEEEVVPTGADVDQIRQFNLGLMARSKNIAVAVAFEQLGYDVVRGDGAQVISVLEDSPAQGSLRPGDVVVDAGGFPIELHSDLVSLVRTRAPGDLLVLTVGGSDSATRTVEVRLAEHPELAGQAFLGVTLTTAGLAFDLPFEVEIDSLDIGGPSAGLAFTLRVLDLLTEGELTGGKRVAVTGTIELDGTVGDVGGVRQKAATVRDAGYELFLVPERDVETARARAGDVVVVGVGTLADALAALREFGGDPLRVP